MGRSRIETLTSGRMLIRDRDTGQFVPFKGARESIPGPSISGATPSQDSRPAQDRSSIVTPGGSNPGV